MRTAALSARETDVLELLATGKPKSVIARELGVAETTVKTVLHAVYVKLEARNAPHAVAIAHAGDMFRNKHRFPRENGLTDREREVLAGLASGLSVVELGRCLRLSPETVKSHLRHLYTKLGAATRSQAVDSGFRCGLLRPAGAR